MSFPLKHIAIILIGVTLFFVILILFLESHGDQANLGGVHSRNSQSNTDTDALEKEIVALRSDMQLLSKQQEKTKQGLSGMITEPPIDNNLFRQTNEQAHSKEESSSSKDEDLTSSASREEQLEREKRFIEDRISNLDSQLSNEDYDNEWSRNAERQLVEVFNKRQLTGSTMLDISCHSTFCRAEVEHESTRAREDFVNKFTFDLPWSHAQGFLHTLKDEDNSGKMHTIFYYSREGEQLPPDQEE